MFDGRQLRGGGARWDGGVEGAKRPGVTFSHHDLRDYLVVERISFF